MKDIDEDVLKLSQELLTFIDKSPTSYHAGQTIVDMLLECGFDQLDESKKWNLKPGCGYYIKHGDSAIVAFRLGLQPVAEAGFKIVGAHTDSPSMKLKIDSEQIVNGCVKVGVEVYGGPIINTWLDRNLSIAGKVLVKDGDEFISKLVDIKDPIAVIPNLAIHLNRDVNKGVEVNKQTQLPVLLSGVDGESGNAVKSMVAGKLDVDQNLIGEMDLFLYDTNKGILSGADESLISSGRIDNLAMCHAITVSLCDSSEDASTAVGVFFDHEEVGSQTTSGADSNLLRNILNRIVLAQQGDNEDFFRAIAQSFMISADGAHAVHPNFADKHDSAHAPEINCGPVIKISANMRYTTTAESANKFIQLCESVDVPYQKMINRSDIPSGSTIGPMCSASVGIKSVDVGNPMWAMHSIREMSGVYDHYYMTEVLRRFYEK